MERERFIEDLEEVGVCKLVYKRKYFLISEEKTVTRSDETGHVYSSWGELFDEAVSEDKTIEYSTPPEPLCPVLRATHSVERAIFLFR